MTADRARGALAVLQDADGKFICEVPCGYIVEQTASAHKPRRIQAQRRRRAMLRRRVALTVALLTVAALLAALMPWSGSGAADKPKDTTAGTLEEVHQPTAVLLPSCLIRRRPTRRRNALCITHRKRTGFRKAGIAAARYSAIRLTDARSASGFKRLSRKRGGGYPIVLLIPARTDTAYFHDYIYGKAEIRFVRGRLRFTDDDGNAADPAPFPSMVVIYNGERVKE